MSLSDIKTEISFGAATAVSSEQMKHAKFDILALNKEKAAAEMGIKIAEEKGWRMEPKDELLISSLTVYVFTPNELRDYIDVQLKKRMLMLAERI